ncbi:hypothetical protein ACWEGX_42185 [Streptomyces chartreusis]
MTVRTPVLTGLDSAPVAVLDPEQTATSPCGVYSVLPSRVVSLVDWSCPSQSYDRAGPVDVAERS